ncbi:tetratricopeptide repeat-containing sensor histidine kinase [Fulvivirga ulvae]|uniref:ATP-binding protein n=1 Tax=Fulvivirga ulvae TaxID=2904245 RepID=UPI001F3CC3B4|nr:tetratricopeptide repeat-containing sensor histidine kinase [Fulvivirga ulvae]UII31336.1 tetratricopeptide repeat-containing sensor histidine kinase [Fulvivirga ulvae]
MSVIHLRIINCIVFIFGSFTLFGQTSQTDSLSARLAVVKEDTSIVRLYIELAKSWKRVNTDSSLHYANLAIDLAKTIEFTTGEAMGLDVRGRVFIAEREFEKAVENFESGLQLLEKQGRHNESAVGYLYNGLAFAHHLQGKVELSATYMVKAVKLFDALHDSTGVMKNAMNAGVAYVDMGSFIKGLELYQLALSYAEKKGHQHYVGLINNNIGVIYRKQKQYDLALIYFNKSFEIVSELGDKSGMANALNNLGLVYENSGEYEKALEYYHKTMELDKETGNEYGIALTFNNIGQILREQKRYDKAIEAYENSFTIMEGLNNKWGQSKALNGLGKVYLEQKAYLKAYRPLNEGYELAKEIGNTELLNQASSNLHEYYEAVGDPKNALKFYRIFYTTQDSLYNEETTKKLARMEAEYEFQKERDSLNFVQQRMALEADQKISRQALIQRVTVAGLVIVLMLAVIIWRYSRLKRRANFELAERNIQIEAQNEEIIAQRDQLEERNRIVEQQKFQLEEVNEELRALNEEKSMLMGVVAHDLKSPLNQILGLIDIAKKSVDNIPPELNIYLEKIHSSANSSTQMINRILDVGAIENKDEVTLHEVKVYPILKKTVEDFQVLARKKDISLKFQETHTELQALIDENYYEQVIQNLISNAIKFSPKGENVFISLLEEGNKIITKVADEGPGISKEDQPKLFNKYETLTARPTDGESSTGLGLAIVKKYVDAMRGTVTCENGPGKGSTFIVSFPKA